MRPKWLLYRYHVAEDLQQLTIFAFVSYVHRELGKRIGDPCTMRK